MIDKEDLDLNYYIRKIRFFGFRLRVLSLLISLTLISDLICLILFATTIRKSDYSPRYYFSEEFYLIMLAISIIGILMLFFFNTMRKQGMTYYEEVTDELAWGKNREEYQQRPPLEFRISIKDFLKSTDLPFTNGINGQIFYLSFFILMIILGIVFKITMLKY